MISGSMVIVCAQIVVAFSEGRLPIPEPPLHEHPTLVAMLKLSNDYRAQNGLARHAVSPDLTKMAQAHAEWMASTGRFQHDNSHSFLEVIYWNAGSIEGAFHGWLSSGPHRGIISSGTTHVGYGYALGPDGHGYWCGIFGNMRGETGGGFGRGS